MKTPVLARWPAGSEPFMCQHDDHAPPHFHVRYGDVSATVSIDELRLLEGSLPPRARGIIIEWATLHQEELRRDWQLAREKAPLLPIAPIE